MLVIKNIYKSFGGQEVLSDLNMSIGNGQIFTLVGGNGSGKTTLFNLVTGFLHLDKGEIYFKNKRIDNKSPVTINSRGITRTFQDLRIINTLTVKENILLSFKNNPGEMIFNSIIPAYTFKRKYISFSEKANRILEKINLMKVCDNLAGELSYGQQKLLSIGCCLANDALLLLLDEPVAGVDSENLDRIFNLLLQLKREGKTILQIEHNHGFIENLSDGIIFLNAGKSSSFANYKSFINDPIVKTTYLTNA